MGTCVCLCVATSEASEEKCDAVYVCRNHLFFHALRVALIRSLLLFRVNKNGDIVSTAYGCMCMCIIFIFSIRDTCFYCLKSAPQHRTRSDFIIRRRHRQFRFFSSIVFVLGFFSPFGKNFHHRLQCIVAQFPIEFIWFCHFRGKRKHTSRHWLSISFSLSVSVCHSIFFYFVHFTKGFICMADICMPIASLPLSVEPCWKIACEMSLEWKVDRPWLCQSALCHGPTVSRLHGHREKK